MSKIKGESPFRIGLIGTGRISDIYLQTCARFPELEIVACGSLNPEESRTKADQYGIARSCTPEEKGASNTKLFEYAYLHAGSDGVRDGEPSGSADRGGGGCG